MAIPSEGTGRKELLLGCLEAEGWTPTVAQGLRGWLLGSPQYPEGEQLALEGLTPHQVSHLVTIPWHQKPSVGPWSRRQLPPASRCSQSSHWSR